MTTFDLILKNCKIIVNDSLIDDVTIGVSEGKIVYIGKKSITVGKCDKQLDAQGNLVLPGAIDAHPHIEDPKFFQGREDFYTASKSALMGGVTSVIEMPTWNPVITLEQIKEKIKLGEEKSFIDFGLHAGNVRDILSDEHLQKLLELGVISFKTFTCKPYFCNDYVIVANLRKFAKYGMIAMFHAENDYIIDGTEKEYKAKKLSTPEIHVKVRPKLAEIEAISRLMTFAKYTGAHVHIVHMSTGEGVEIIKRAKEEGLNVTVETCPHYLYFTEEDMKKLGPYLKVNPPVRSKNDLEKLWLGLREGVIDIVTSDHYPTFKHEREVGWTNIWEVRSGLPGIATMYPLMIHAALTGRISFRKLINLLAENVAKIFGLYPRKGWIGVGADADLVVVNPNKETKITAEKFLIHSGWTPFEGFTVKGRIEYVVCKGEVAVEQEEFKLTKPKGKYIKRYSKTSYTSLKRFK